jgi:hypothetical protein
MQQTADGSSALDWSQRTQCAITAELVEWSSANSEGLTKGTVAPWASAVRRISASSVDTMTREKQPLSIAASIDHASMGLSRNMRMFFRGIRLLPPRAGMIAIGPKSGIRMLYPRPRNREAEQPVRHGARSIVRKWTNVAIHFVLAVDSAR